MISLHRQNEEQKISYRSLDLSKNYNDVESTIKSIENDIGEIFMLVNCAGMAICGTVDEMTVEDAHLMMNVNYFSTYYPTRYILSKMKKNREGIIVMTASQVNNIFPINSFTILNYNKYRNSALKVALFGIYGYGAYAAAKFALRGLAETIAMEVKHLNISVTLALPADTNTPGFEKEEKTKPQETKLISGSGGLAEPDDVAKKILNDALKGDFFSVYGFESWIAAVMCVGMAPWKGPILNVAQVLLVGPLRAIGIILQWNFYRIVKNCAKLKQN